jgi:hypothetical protein
MKIPFLQILNYLYDCIEDVESSLWVDRSILPSIRSLPTPAYYPTNHSVYPNVGRDDYTIH